MSSAVSHGVALLEIKGTHLQAELHTHISKEPICSLIYAFKIDNLPLSAESAHGYEII